MKPLHPKREQILQATLELILEKGLNELTTAKIARRSNTAETIIYRHFSGKNEIVAEVMRRTSQEIQLEAEKVFAEPISPVEKLAKLSAGHFAYVKKTRGVSRLLFSEQIHLADPLDPLKIFTRQYLTEYRSRIRRIIAEGKRFGQFDAGLDEEMASRSFMGLHYLLMLEWSVNDFGWDPLEYNDKVIAYFLKAWAPAQEDVFSETEQLGAS